jgi:hypothetical protein
MGVRHAHILAMTSSARTERLGLPIDQTTMDLIDPRGGVVEAEETRALALSDLDREAFFSALIDPPPLHPRLARALTAHAGRVEA